MREIIVAITGASGARYAIRLLQALVDGGRRVHLTISEAGAKLLKHEMDIDVECPDCARKFKASLDVSSFFSS